MIEQGFCLWSGAYDTGGEAYDADAYHTTHIWAGHTMIRQEICNWNKAYGIEEGHTMVKLGCHHLGEANDTEAKHGILRQGIRHNAQAYDTHVGHRALGRCMPHQLRRNIGY